MTHLSIDLDETEPRLTPAHAARLAGLTPAAIKYHDDILNPELDSNGRRTYRLATVLAFVADRAATKAGR